MELDDVTQVGIVREFGMPFLATFNSTLDSPAIKNLLEKSMDETRELFNHLKVVKYVEEFHTVEGPVTDIRARFRNFGWYGRVASPGYDAFEEHFRCHKEHTPKFPTLKYIRRMIVRYAESLMEKEDN